MTNRNKAVLWVLAVFLLGALSGGSLVYLLILPDSFTPAASRPGRGQSQKRAIERLSKDLDLDQKQQAEVDKIFQDARRDSHEAFKEIRSGIHRRLKQVLRPDQFARYEKIMRERRQGAPGDRGAPPPEKDGRPPR
ncbi:MAG: hypothetical protein ACE15E_14430 [Acidobacteriota bacterium]